MGTIEKRIKKFYRKPIPNDITFDDVEALANYFGCIIATGGNHSKKVVHKESGTVIPIPIESVCCRIRAKVSEGIRNRHHERAGGGVHQRIEPLPS